MFFFWLLLFFGVLQNSAAFECYNCKSNTCSEKDLKLVTCSTTPVPTTPAAPTTAKPTTTKPTSSTAKTEGSTPLVTKDSDTEKPTDGVPEPEIADSEEDMISEADLELLKKMQKKADEENKRSQKLKDRYYSKAESASDPWKCFTQKHESRLNEF